MLLIDRSGERMTSDDLACALAPNEMITNGIECRAAPLVRRISHSAAESGVLLLKCGVRC